MRSLLVAVSLIASVLPALAEPPRHADVALEVYIYPKLTVGDVLAGSVILTNRGPDQAENVVVTTSAGAIVGYNCPGTASCTFDILPAGAERQLAIRLEREPVPASVAITAVVTSTTRDLNPRNNRGSGTAAFSLATRLRFALYGGLADPGGTAEYKGWIWNESWVAATNVRFTLPLPEGWSFERSLTEGFDCSAAGRDLECRLAVAPPRTASEPRFLLRAPMRPEGVPYTSVPVPLSAEHGIVAEERDITAFFSTAIYRYLTVTHTGDDGAGSLRNAITVANTECTPHPTAPCKVVFDIAGAGSHQTIRPSTPLPAIKKGLRIDGATQTARHGDTNPLGPEIEINGSLLATGNGLEIEADSNVQLNDLVINGFPGDGVTVRSSTVFRLIERCYIGTDATGRTAVPNGGRGVVVDIPGQYNSAYLHLRDNVISGNARSGVFLNSAFEVTLSGNRIGASAGERPEPLPNGASGIYVGPRASAIAIIKNVIAHNRDAGIATAPQTGYVAIRGNSIYANGGLGIDFGLDSVTPNPGPNGYGAIPSYPLITSARYDPATGITRIEGRVELQFGPSIAEVELFANTSDGHHGELFLGRVPLSNTRFALDYQGDLRGRFITGTFTRSTNYYPEILYLETGELSAGFRVEGDAPAPIDPAVTVPRGADLRLRLTPPYRLPAGVPQLMTISVENFGPAVPGPAVVDITAAGGRLKSSDSRCTATASGDALRCTLPDLRYVTFEIEASLSAEAMTVHARAASAVLDPDLTNNEASVTLPVTLQPSFELQVDSPGPAEPGGTVTYAVRLAQRTAAPSRDVEFRVQYPEGWSLESSGTNGWSCRAEAPEIVCRKPRVEGLSFETFTYMLRAPANDEGVQGFGMYARVVTADGVLFMGTSYASYAIYRTYTVTSTADDGDGSLRDAIERANDECAPRVLRCKINFALGAATASNGVFTFKPLRPLPAIAQGDISIDGFSQTLETGDTNPLGPEIEINGSRAGARANGLEILAGGTCVIRGLVINGFSDNGILVRWQDATHHGRRRVVADSYIGTDATGRIAVPNGGRGISIDRALDLPTDLDILGNVISGNARAGIFAAAALGVRIVGNRIGLIAGELDVPLPNGASGIYLGRTDTMHIEGNTIAYNAHAGIAVDRGAEWPGMRGNAVFSNGGLGIDHGLDEVTFNNAPSRRADLPQFPVILSAVYDAAENVTRIEGRAEGSVYGAIVELFANAAADGSGYGEAQRPLGELVLPPSEGETAFTFTIAEDLRGSVVTSTLSRRGPYRQDWTSEISQAVPVE